MAEAIGAVAGGVLGGKGGGDQSTTSQVAPFAPTIPRIENILTGAEDLFNTGQLGRVAPFAQDQLSGFEATRGAAGQITPFLGQTLDSIGGILGGAANPWQEAVEARALGLAERTANQQARAFGRQGSPAATQQAAELGIQAIAPIAFQGYQQGIQNQLSAAGLAPGLSQAQFIPGSALQGIGAIQQGQQQSVFDGPFNSLQQFASLVSPFTGIGGTTTNTTPGVGALQGGISGALSGLQLAGNLGGGGFSFNPFAF